MRIRTKTMTEGSPWKHILKFSLPVLLGSLMQQLYNTADTLIVGRVVGEDALAAVGTGFLITWSFYLSGRCMRSREE